jgi:hypothetical protein
MYVFLLHSFMYYLTPWHFFAVKPLPPLTNGDRGFKWTRLLVQPSSLTDGDQRLEVCSPIGLIMEQYVQNLSCLIFVAEYNFLISHVACILQWLIAWRHFQVYSPVQFNHYSPLTKCAHPVSPRMKQYIQVLSHSIYVIEYNLLIFQVACILITRLIIRTNSAFKCAPLSSSTIHAPLPSALAWSVQ